MLEFSDTPYQFYPAKPNALVIWLGRILNRRLNLPSRRHRIQAVEISAEQPLEELRTKLGPRVLFIANHSTHSDPQIITETHLQLGIRSCFMAAYDVFERDKLTSWFMQRGGCFSVNRDGNDSKSMKEAMRILSDGRYALTLFPEGNVYLMNDRVTPFMDGAAFIALKAQKQLGTDHPIHVVPLSIKATHLTDQRDEVYARINRLAKTIGTELDRSAPAIDEIKRVGLRALERILQQRGMMTKDPAGKDVPAHLEHCAQLMIQHLERKMALAPRATASPTDRIRTIRAQIHKIRTDMNRKVDHQVAMTWADEAMVALRVLSYSGQYLDEKPTLDRFAESAEKLLEDVFSELQLPHGDRHAFVRVNQPINLAEALDDFANDARSTIQTLTAKFESVIQTGLDSLNASNPHAGAKPF